MSRSSSMASAFSRASVYRMAVDQGIAGGEVLPQSDHGVVDGGVAVGVVLAQHRADDVGRLAAAVRGPHPLLVRAPEDAPVDRLEPVPHVRQRPGHDHAHRVVEERALHLFLDLYWLYSSCVWHVVPSGLPGLLQAPTACAPDPCGGSSLPPRPPKSACAMVPVVDRIEV